MADHPSDEDEIPENNNHVTPDEPAADEPYEHEPHGPPQYDVCSEETKPVRRVLGLTHGHRRNGVKRRAFAKPDEVIEIPFLESIEQMLNDRSILYEIENPHKRADGLLADYCDGETFKNHPLFSVDPTALQIMLYYDEIEIVNPLGSKTSKHKLGTED
ncbi:hypothetical protein QZH41_008022 [Actinostola sp. cb2023]|nr:hypothetical protein QZH41_008022 [Actinostola sp. cb2023]